MALTWLIIAVVLLAAFGPIFWLIPSKKDRRLSALRQDARLAGLTVELRQIPKTNPTAQERVSAGGVVREPTRTCAAYAHTLAHRLARLPGWRALLEKGARDGPLPDWVFDPRPAASPHLQRMFELATPSFERFDSGVVGLEVTPRSILVYWLENADSSLTVEELAEELRALAARFQGLEEQIEQELIDEDS